MAMVCPPDRETVMQALFALFAGLPGFTTIARRVTMPGQGPASIVLHLIERELVPPAVVGLRRAYRRGSAPARRLVVLSVADMRAPGGALALLAGFRQRQMREQAIGRGAVPVHRIRRDIDRIARVQHLRLLALEADAADAGQTEECLPNRVGVPCGASARGERNDRTSKAR